jgi:signal peptidase I
MPKPRNSWFAALLTLLSPGLGHLYAGRPWQAVAWAFTLQALAVLLPFFVLATWFGRLAVGILWLLPLAVILPVAHSWWVARRAPVPFSLHATNRWYIYLTFAVVNALLGHLSIQPWVRSQLRAFRMPSGSMEPTLLIGDFIYVHLQAPEEIPASPGALVVFESSEEPGLQVLKRIVAVPGDTVWMKHGELYRNGAPVPEAYVKHENIQKTESPEYRRKIRAWQIAYALGVDTTDYSPDISDWGPLLVPTDSLFVLGDNREASYDSRYYGWIARNRLLGSPSIIYYSYDPLSPRLLPPLSAIRWARLGLRFPAK